MDLYVDEFNNKYFKTEYGGNFKQPDTYYKFILIRSNDVSYETVYEKKQQYIDYPYMGLFSKFNVSKLSDCEIAKILEVLYSIEYENDNFHNNINKLISYLENEKSERIDKISKEENKKYKKALDLKLLEIDAINKNTEMQKYLAESVLGAVTYLAQMLKDKS